MQRLAAILLLVAIGLAACDGSTTPTTEGGAESPPGTEAPETTDPPPDEEAPPTTEAPDTTDAATTTAGDGGESGDEADSETPWWILIVVGVGVVILIGALIARGSKSGTAVAPATTWKTNARAGYTAARWLYDAMGEDIAVWRGNAQFEGTSGVDAAAGSAKAETWAELQRRQSSASDALYALEADAPDNRTQQAASDTLRTMRATRDAVDARAEARFAYRTAEAADADQAALVTARDREVRASRNLADARSAFARALTSLSSAV